MRRLECAVCASASEENMHAFHALVKKHISLIPHSRPSIHLSGGPTSVCRDEAYNMTTTTIIIYACMPIGLSANRRRTAIREYMCKILGEPVATRISFIHSFIH